jgi:hypothetical protein
LRGEGLSGYFFVRGGGERHIHQPYITDTLLAWGRARATGPASHWSEPGRVPPDGWLAAIAANQSRPRHMPWLDFDPPPQHVCFSVIFSTIDSKYFILYKQYYVDLCVYFTFPVLDKSKLANTRMYAVLFYICITLISATESEVTNVDLLSTQPIMKTTPQLLVHFFYFLLMIWRRTYSKS